MYAILRIVGRIVAVTGLLAGLAAGYGSGARAGTAVDLALVMAIDVSGSVDETEARLQRQGYVAAFSHPEVIAAIRSGTLGRIAVLYFEWSDYSHQSLVVDWTVIDSDTAARAFSTLLAETPISRGRRTSISGAIDFGVAQFSRSPFDGTRKVIDISGDGPNNSGPTVTSPRDGALAQGITINGLPVVNDRMDPYGAPQMPDLDRYYLACVIGGPGSFIVVAKDFHDFANAVRRKLVLEIAGGEPDARHASNQSVPAQLRIAQAAPAPLPQYGRSPQAIFPPGCDAGERYMRQRFLDFNSGGGFR
ncbi:MAG: DUF1194 domain-containing protein [Alphaproteobacteria bacterium]